MIVQSSRKGRHCRVVTLWFGSHVDDIRDSVQSIPIRSVLTDDEDRGLELIHIKAFAGVVVKHRTEIQQDGAVLGDLGLCRRWNQNTASPLRERGLTIQASVLVTMTNEGWGARPLRISLLKRERTTSVLPVPVSSHNKKPVRNPLSWRSSYCKR